MLKILQSRLQQYMNNELPDIQAEFRKGRWTTDQIANISWIIKKATQFQKASISTLLTMSKPLTMWIKTVEILQEMGIPPHLTCLLRYLYAGQEATVRTGHGTTDWFVVIQAVYCHPAYLTYMQSTSWEMLDWMKHKLESRLLGEISVTSDMQITPSCGRKPKTKEPLDESERGEWKSWLKSQHSEN